MWQRARGAADMAKGVRRSPPRNDPTDHVSQIAITLDSTIIVPDAGGFMARAPDFRLRDPLRGANLAEAPADDVIA